MADTCRYQEQLTCTAELIAEDLGWDDWQLVYQSRSGRPQDPWLGPDVCDYLRTAKQQRVQAVVLVPIGFVCDHIEVLYDLDVEAAQVAKKIDLPLVRASALNTDTRFINMLADQVQSTAQRFALYPPLPLNR
jgi:ferrochelatase